MDLQSRINAAKSAGYNDQQIQSYLSQNKMSQGAGRAGGAKGFLLDITPFGRVAEKVINPNAGNITGGEVLTEAALTAIPFGLGRVFKGARAAKGLTGAIRSSEKPLQTTEAVMQARKGLVQRTGEKLSSAGSSLKVGENVGDINKLSQQSQRVAKYSGTPTTQLKKIDADMKTLSSQVDDILTKTPVKLDGSMVSKRIQQASTDLTDERFADLDLLNPSAQKIIERYSAKFDKVTDAKGVNDVVKTLNKTATRASNKLQNPNAAPLTAQETAALALKRAGDDVLGEIPEIAPIKQQMAQLFEINPQVAKASERGFGLPFMSGTKIKAPMQMLQGLQSKAGALLQGAGTSAPATGGFRPFIKPALQQAGVRVGADALGVRPKPEDTPEASQFTTPFVTQPTLEDVTAPEANGSLFTNPALLEQAYSEAIARGDSETANSLIKGYELFGKQGGGGKPLSAEASKVIATANSGLQSLSQLEQMISEGGVPKGTTIPGRGLLGGAGQSLLGTTGFDAAADNVADAMVRARTGAAATKEELALYRRLLPQAFDPPEVQQQKMQTVRDYFTSIANRTGSSGTDLQQAAGY